MSKVLTEEELCRRYLLDGVLLAAQFMAIDHDEGGYAEDILRMGGFSEKEMLDAQRRSGYESRTMCKLIRRAAPKKGKA